MTNKKPLITPNMLTNFRIVLTFVMLYLLIQPSFIMQVWGGVCFIVAITTDYFDGVLARKTGLITDYGKIADPVADKFLIVGMFIELWYLGLFSGWWIVPIIIREVLVTVLRFILLGHGQVIAAESAGKLKVGFQTAALILGWIVLVFGDSLAGSAYGMGVSVLFLVALAGALILTVYSGVLFLIRNERSLAKVGVARFVALFAGSGLSPIMPGTAGSLAACIVIYAFRSQSVLFWSVISVLTFIVGVWSARRVSEVLQVEDPSEVVIDEVVGMFLALMAIPFSIGNLFLGFILFRVFDILKPWPIKKLEQYPNGYGVMLDDVLAGIFANICLRIILHFI